ncbi:hypothetical protein HDU67_000765 [Dinochytrium kinnereticum]|nr:hypothetical protein HDU67_000765 [Dinochytrium kinnereticum]
MSAWKTQASTDIATAKKLWRDTHSNVIKQSSSSNDQVDKIFVYFCGLSCHPDKHVRVLAINILGTFHKVPMGTLMQTLSKTPIDGRPHYYKNADCGNFIHGLEDEYQSVRGAVVDMLNDEIESVRLASVRSLKKVAFYSSVTVDDFQLQSLLTVFDDNNRVMREVAYELLQ